MFCSSLCSSFLYYYIILYHILWEMSLYLWYKVWKFIKHHLFPVFQAAKILIFYPLCALSLRSDNLLPALRISRIKIPVFPACYCGTATAECKQLTLGTFLKFCIITICFHLANPDIRKTVIQYISNFAPLYPAAGVNISRW